MLTFFHRNIEILLWSVALLYLAVINPDNPQIFSLCLFHNLGIEFCPGCGLGRGISYLLHGNAVLAMNTHVLAIPAVVILFHRIVFLSFHRYFKKFYRPTY